MFSEGIYASGRKEGMDEPPYDLRNFRASAAGARTACFLPILSYHPILSSFHTPRHGGSISYLNVVLPSEANLRRQ